MRRAAHVHSLRTVRKYFIISTSLPVGKLMQSTSVYYSAEGVHQTGDSLSVLPGPRLSSLALTSPRNLLEMQVLRCHPRPPESQILMAGPHNLGSNKSSK